MASILFFPGHKCKVTQITNYIYIVPHLRLNPHKFITHYSVIVVFWVKVGSQVVNVLSGLLVASYF
jgi:hypothetical protein